MSKTIRLLFAAAVSMLALAALTSTAGAFEATAEPAGEFSSPSINKVTFGEGFTSIECNLTLSGVLNEGPIPLAAGGQFGEITEVRWANCENGEVAEVLGLPWPLKIHQILGTAPNELRGFDFELIGSEFQLEGFLGVECLYGPEEPATEGARGLQEAIHTGRNTYITGNQTADPTKELPLQEGSFLCPGTGSFIGTFAMEPTQTVIVS